MRISQKYGVIFLANPKCASNTVERYLRVYTCDAAAPPGQIRHVDATILDRYMNEAGLSYDDFLVFTTIRNPWDRLVSLWEYAKIRPDSFWYPTAIAAGSFSDFLRTDMVSVDFVAKFGLHGFTHTPDGRKTVDDVVCVERFATGLPLMFRRLGLDFVDTGVHVNRTKRDTYRSYYDDADRQLVADLFTADIEFGAYEF